MIGGNITALLQAKKGYTTNAIGETSPSYETIIELVGFLDMQSYNTHRTYLTKIEEATHVFICDFIELEDTNSEDKRMLINNKSYDVLFIDNPMELNKHLEIYLKRIGG